MTDTTNRKRQPAGVPTGGEFAHNEHDEAGGALVAQNDPFVFPDDADIDDLDTLNESQRARLAAIEDDMLATPHAARLEDGRVGIFWHERRGDNERDQRPDREARAILDEDGTISDFAYSIDHGDWESADDLQDEMNSRPLRESNLPDAPTETVNDEGQPVFTGSLYREGASGAEIGRSMRKSIDAAVKDGTLPEEFNYTVRATDLHGNRVVGIVYDIRGWKHGDNYGLTPGQTIYDQSPARCAKVERAERYLEKLVEAHDRKTVIDETTTQHAFTDMISQR